ncbi:MAG: GNAT family N-acetyltransferase [Thaumarchaeota archaeon]|nr:GNAT family N-acetyltransferase [Nitrososphaerota archaeon]
MTTEGVDDSGFWVAKNVEDKLIGAVGLETWGNQGLLRSLVVEKSYRGLGVGRSLVLHTVELARKRKLKELFLITEAVKDYYLKFGFEVLERNNVEGQVLGSAEFRGACLESADVMRIIL